MKAASGNRTDRNERSGHAYAHDNGADAAADEDTVTISKSDLRRMAIFASGSLEGHQAAFRERLRCLDKESAPLAQRLAEIERERKNVREKLHAADEHAQFLKACIGPKL